jgi:hypothetical protein
MMDFRSTRVFGIKKADNREFHSWQDYQLQDTS